jgi:hypothetical protein
MSLGKRHIGRRVAGVGVAVGLMVLGLQAPAFAAPTTTSFSPTSGPAGCVVVVTGTGFKASPAAQISVNFVTTATGTPVDTADTKTIISDTEIWATVPSGTLVGGTGYLIRVDDALLGQGTASATTFTFTADAGTCAPTITSFTPLCGVSGDVLTITGTNLLAPTEIGGLVEFAPYTLAAGAAPDGLDASNTAPDISSPTTLQVLVPGTSAAPLADGPIQISTFDTDAVAVGAQGGRVQSTTLFQTPPPDCVTGPTSHARSISFKIKSTGKASGKVSSTEDPAFTDCVAAVPVKIQRKTSSGWKTVGKTTTTDTGSYSKKVKNPKGKQKFRALAPKVSLGDPVTDVCSKAKSAVRKV